MIFTSRCINFLTFGSMNETLCSRIFRRWATGSNAAGFLMVLINYVFWVITGEIDHVYNSYREGKK